MHHDIAFSLPDLDDEDDTPLDTELLLSTHRTVVVRARIAGPLGRSPTREVGLVIARQHCAGDRPRRHALFDAAQRSAERAGVAPGQIQAQVDGRWMALGALSVNPPPRGTSAMNTSSFRTHAVAACAGLLTFAGAGAAMAAGPAQDTYRQERAACMTGHTSQDRATCLREAGAALQETRRNGLVTPTADQAARNAVQRCERQPPEERADCMRLARGEGQTEGSVAQGAVVREITTVQMEPTAAGK